MFKKFFTYPVFLVLFLSFIGSILFGALLMHHYKGGDRFKNLQNIALFFAKIPYNMRAILNLDQETAPLLVDNEYQLKLKDYKPEFNFKNKEELDILFLLNATNPFTKKHSIDLIDLKTYKTIFSYDFNNYDLFKIIESENNKLYAKYIKDKNFALRSTFLTSDINFIALMTSNILIKFSPITNEIIWYNDKYNFHHTFYVNEIENYIWAIGCAKKSKLDKMYLSDGLCDDSVIKIDLNSGKILDEISITQLMIDAKLHNHLFIGRLDVNAPDPLHINDVEEVNSYTTFSEKKNLFISLGHTNMILLINPNTKKILWKLHDKLFHQHDVDIIDSERIAIFNNNRIYTDRDKSYKNNEINIYNFTRNEFSSPYDKFLEKYDVKTVNQGLFEITKYGLFIEEQNSGRYLFLNNEGEIIFEYINKSRENNKVYQVHWSRLITKKEKITKMRKRFNNE